MIEGVVKLYSKFESLQEDRKMRIIDVCIEEFAQNGYENASTNSIVKKAEISKGILFHYFGNKKNLYLFIVDYIVSFLTEKFFEMDESPPEDIFEKIMNAGLVKLKIAYEYPMMYKIVFEAFTQTHKNVKNEILGRYDRLYKEVMPMFLKNLDMSRFRKDIDKGKAVELIMFALEGVGNKYMKMLKDRPYDSVPTEMESIIQEYKEYIKILKVGIYDDEV